MSSAEKNWKSSEFTGEMVFYYQFHSGLSYRVPPPPTFLLIVPLSQENRVRILR